VGLHWPLPAGRDATDPSQLNATVEYAIPLFPRLRAAGKKFREPGTEERKALLDLRDALSNLPAEATAEQIQDVLYDVGRRPPFLDEKKKAKDGKPGVSLDWFNMLYQCCSARRKARASARSSQSMG